MQLKPGVLLQGGKYRIEKVLGQGGFGITYLALQTNLKNRKVAIKEFFLREHCERDSDTSHVSMGTSGSKEIVSKFKDKFVKEAETIAEMENNHIIKVHDIFEENGTAYYVMEYLSGGSLSAMIPSNGLQEAQAIGHIRQIAEALSYIHNNNILHLDIKPSNILYRKSDEVVLIDFGISKHYDDEGGSQTSSTPVGTSNGFAPLEQYKRGGLAQFTPATDVYSLGATLYKILTGQTPPDANDVYEYGLPHLPDYITHSTSEAVRKAMSPRRQDRPQSIEEFLALLDESVNNSDIITDNESDKTKIYDKKTNNWCDLKEFLHENRFFIRTGPSKRFRQGVLIFAGIALVLTCLLVYLSIIYDTEWLSGLVIWYFVLFLGACCAAPEWKTRHLVYDVEKLEKYENRKIPYPFRVRDKDGKMGLCTIFKRGIVAQLEIEYDEIIKVDEYSFICRKGMTYGLYRYNMRPPWILPLEYDMIEILPDNSLKATKGNHTCKYTSKGYRVV